MVVFLGLTTLDVNPSLKSALDDALDAQVINAVFLGIGIVLALCAFFDRDGALGRVGRLEADAIRRSYKLTLWSRIGGLASNGIRVREDHWIGAVVVVYALLVSLVAWPMVEGLWVPAESVSERGVTPVVAITLAALGIPAFVFLRTVQWRLLAWVYSVGMVGLLVWLGFGIRPLAMPKEVGPVREGPPTVTRHELDTLVQKIQFGTDSFELTDSAKRVMRAKVNILRRHDGLKVRIVGHADRRGPTRMNDTLGMQRAAEACRALAREGIDRRRVLLVSFGEMMPLTDGGTGQELAVNRRVEFEIMRAEGPDTLEGDWVLGDDLVAWDATSMRLVAKCPA